MQHNPYPSGRRYRSGAAPILAVVFSVGFLLIAAVVGPILLGDLIVVTP